MINGRITKEIRNKIMNTSRPSTVGKIKTGMKNEKGYPISLDYFVATSDTKIALEMFKEVIGDKPKEMLITFESNKISEVCIEQIVYDKNGKRLAYGDGTNFMIYDELQKKHIERQMTGAELKAKFGVEYAVELLVIFKLVKLPELFGLWEYRTKAVKSTITQITEVFDKTLEYCNKNDLDFTKVLFQLNVKKHKSFNLSNTQYPVVSLVPLFVGDSNNIKLLNNNKPLELSKWLQSK